MPEPATAARSARLDELIRLVEALMPAEPEADIARANPYLASEAGRREFGHLPRAAANPDRV